MAVKPGLSTNFSTWVKCSRKIGLCSPSHTIHALQIIGLHFLVHCRSVPTCLVIATNTGSTDHAFPSYSFLLLFCLFNKMYLLLLLISFSPISFQNRLFLLYLTFLIRLNNPRKYLTPVGRKHSTI